MNECKCYIEHSAGDVEEIIQCSLCKAAPELLAVCRNIYKQDEKEDFLNDSNLRDLTEVLNADWPESEIIVRKVIVEMKMCVTMVVNEGIEISEIINELDYQLNDTTGNAFITDTEITDYQVIDSK